MTLQEPGAERDRLIEQAIPPSGCASYKKRATARHFLDFLPEFFGRGSTCRNPLDNRQKRQFGRDGGR